MDWKKKYVEDKLQSGACLCAGISFIPSIIWSGEGKERNFSHIYKPHLYWDRGSFHSSCVISELAQAEKDAHLLRRSILDEDLPNEGEFVGNEGFFKTGRHYNITLLGMIGYGKAIPELVECAGHDLEESLRVNALDALCMLEVPKNYSYSISAILQNDRSLWVREEAAKLLGIIKDKRSISCIMDNLEESRLVARTTLEMGYFTESDKEKRALCLENGILFEKLLIALYNINPKLAEREFDKSFQYGSPLINHHTKRAIFLTESRRKYVLTPDESVERPKIIDMPFQLSENDIHISENDPIF